MRQIWITRAGPPEVLVVKEAPDPEAKKGEVRVRVRASGINFADLMARVGLYPDAPKIPCVVGYEVSGTIDEIGEGVTGFEKGERVLAMCKFGGYSDVVVLPALQLIKMPAKMSFEEGAALPVVYLTAYNMMLFNGYLRPKSSVLVHSAVLRRYRENFVPSPRFREPWAILGVGVICADSDADAERLALSSELAMVWFRQGIRDRPLPSVEEALAYQYDDVEQALRIGPAGPLLVGGLARVRERIIALVEATRADEVMVLTHVHNHEARKRSYELVAEALVSP
jgi:hypothetical protein